VVSGPCRSPGFDHALADGAAESLHSSRAASYNDPAMPTPLTPEEIERLAHKRAAAKLGWYFHACVYIVVNGALFLGSYFGIRTRPWNIYPTLGWGVALALHFVSVFVLGKGSSLRRQLVDRERERIQREQNRL
jgi:hypothetical protein